MVRKAGNNCLEHVKLGVFSSCNLVFKGLTRDIEIPYSFQLAFVKELLAEIL